MAPSDTSGTFGLSLPGSPVHHWFHQPTQYLVKLQRYSAAPPEFTVQQRKFDRDVTAYESAYDKGFSSCFTSRRRTPPEPGAVRSEESIERSQRRAKINVRRTVTELAPNHFSTFTTREAGPTYLTPDDWAAIWASFVRLVRVAGLDFEYVAVLERHPSNPLHLHLHVAWRGHAHYNQLRRFWHMAILGHRGVKVTRVLRGAESPGGVSDKYIKAPRGGFKRVRKIAKYISKYITKDLICEFNKRRYWPSKGINVESAQVFWLSSLDQQSAIREACELLGQWDYEASVPAQKMFRPSDRIAWFAVDPGSTPPPPF